MQKTLFLVQSDVIVRSQSFRSKLGLSPHPPRLYHINSLASCFPSSFSRPPSPPTLYYFNPNLSRPRGRVILQHVQILKQGISKQQTYSMGGLAFSQVRQKFRQTRTFGKRSQRRQAPEAPQDLPLFSCPMVNAIYEPSNAPHLTMCFAMLLVWSAYMPYCIHTYIYILGTASAFPSQPSPFLQGDESTQPLLWLFPGQT